MESKATDLSEILEITEQTLESLNDISEQLIREEYLSAQLHGPHWALGLDGQVI